MEDHPFWEEETDGFIREHRFAPVLNDYVRTNGATTNDGFVRLLFQPADQRPVFVIINCVSNSVTHPQWQLLVNYGGYGDGDFSGNIAEWRAVIDSVKAPPPRLGLPAIVSSHLQFTVPGQRGQTNRVEVSSDLRNWFVVTNLIGTNASITLREPAASTAVQRFYRVFRP